MLAWESDRRQQCIAFKVGGERGDHAVHRKISSGFEEHVLLRLIVVSQDNFVSRSKTGQHKRRQETRSVFAVDTVDEDGMAGGSGNDFQEFADFL